MVENRQHPGFSLIEVCIALGILSIVILALGATFLSTHRVTEAVQSEREVAFDQVRSRLDKYLSLPLDALLKLHNRRFGVIIHPDEKGNALHDPPHLLTNPESKTPDQVGVVSVTPLALPTDSTGGPKLHWVTITVEWKGKAGLLRIELTGQHRSAP